MERAAAGRAAAPSSGANRREVVVTPAQTVPTDFEADIAAVNQIEIRNLAEMEERVGNSTRRLLLTIVRGRRGFYVEMQ